MKPTSGHRLTAHLVRIGVVVTLTLLSAPALAIHSGSAGRSTPSPSAHSWVPTHFPTIVTQTKFAAEELLYELGNQPFIIAAAKRKGAPITMRLANADVPNGIEGIDSELLYTRFYWFTRGHSDVRAGRSPRYTDVDVRLSVVPRGAQSYALKIEARVAHGHARGHILYAQSRVIE